eukprot:22975-Pelagococcus_subviridis.AAC.1
MQVWNPTNNKCVSRENSFPVPSRPFRNCTGGAFRDARARATTPRDELRSSKRRPRRRSSALGSSRPRFRARETSSRAHAASFYF